MQPALARSLPRMTRVPTVVPIDERIGLLVPRIFQGLSIERRYIASYFARSICALAAEVVRNRVCFDLNHRLLPVLRCASSRMQIRSGPCRRVVLRRSRPVEFGMDRFAHHLAELDSPLIERIDLPDNSLGKTSCVRRARATRRDYAASIHRAESSSTDDCRIVIDGQPMRRRRGTSTLRPRSSASLWAR